MQNPFKSMASTNQLRGWPVSGRLLTIDFEEYFFGKELLRSREIKSLPLTIRVLENSELTQVLNIEADAMIAMFIDGSDYFEMSWPNGSKESWTAQRYGGMTRLSGGYGGGAVIAADDEWKTIARKVLEMTDTQ